MRSTRSDIYKPDEIAVVHVMAKTVRHMFLFGYDEFTRKCYDHRRSWIEQQLFLQAKFFGIDLIAYAVMSNHFHLVLCSRPDIVKTWDDTEVAKRWLYLCPKRKDASGNALEPNEKELDSIRTKPKEVEKIRLRLSDISWWMRLACQKIAQKANWEMKETGRFFNGRFKSVRLLDDEAILACMVYVDLNPIRACISQTPELSELTSIKRRIEALNELGKKYAERSDGPLRPIELKDSASADAIASQKNSKRCSDKGLLRMTSYDYTQLVELTGQLPRIDKPGSIPDKLPPLLERLNLEMETWRLWTQEFGSLFSQAAGKVTSLAEARTLVSNRKYYCRAYRGKQA